MTRLRSRSLMIIRLRRTACAERRRHPSLHGFACLLFVVALLRLPLAIYFLHLGLLFGCVLLHSLRHSNVELLLLFKQFLISFLAFRILSCLLQAHCSFEGNSLRFRC